MCSEKAGDNSAYYYKLPTVIRWPKVRKEGEYIYRCNMNNLKAGNLHIYRKAKEVFKPISEDPFRARKIKISYKLMAKRTNTDIMNEVSVVDKFFLDWLVNNKMIPDDTGNNVIYGGITVTYDKAIKEDYVIAKIIILEGIDETVSGV